MVAYSMWKAILYFLRRNVLSVFARLACRRVVGFLDFAALFSFLAEMVLLPLTPSFFRSAPGFLIAFCIHFLAMFFLPPFLAFTAAVNNRCFHLGAVGGEG